MKTKLHSVKNRASAVVNHVHHRRGRYAAATTLAVTVYAFNKMDRVGEWNAFLAEKGLTNEFYLPE